MICISLFCACLTSFTTLNSLIHVFFVLMLQLGYNGDLSKISEKSSLVGSHFLCNGLVGNEQQVAEGVCIVCIECCT